MTASTIFIRYRLQALLMLRHDAVLIVLQYTTVTTNTGTTTTIGVNRPQIENTVTLHPLSLLLSTTK